MMIMITMMVISLPYQLMIMITMVISLPYQLMIMITMLMMIMITMLMMIMITMMVNYLVLIVVFSLFFPHRPFDSSPKPTLMTLGYNPAHKTALTSSRFLVYMSVT
jgi:hypothetical protein